MTPTADNFALAKTLHQAGDLAGAERLYRQTLAEDPSLAEAQHLLAILLASCGKLDEAIGLFESAARLRPDVPEFAAGLRRGRAAAHFREGNALAARGARAEAVDQYRRALDYQADSVETLNNLAAVLNDMNRLDEAADCCRRATQINPRAASPFNNLAVILRDQGKLDESAEAARRAISLKPDYAEAWYNLANVAADQGRLDDAAASFQHASELKPSVADFHNNLAITLWMQQKYDAAIVSFRRALELRPDYVGASRNFAALFVQQGNVAAAKAVYEDAMRFHPNDDIWRLEIASLCPSMFDDNVAIDLYRAELLSSLNDFAARDLSFDFSKLATSGCRPPFNLACHGGNDRPLREAYARVFGRSFPGRVARGSEGKPRVGIVVTDQNESLFWRSLGGVLDRIDPELFDITIICSARGASLLRGKLHNTAIRLAPIASRPDRIPEQILAARYDLLYYWEIGTDGTNYFLPYERLAPVQCTSWGIQVTSGIPNVDCYLSSALAEGPGAADDYSERLVLANTLLTYQYRATLSASPKTRGDFGIAPDRNLYVCAQQLIKFQPEFDPILTGILRRDSRGLVIMTGDRRGGTVGSQLRARFERAMPDVVERIVMVPFLANPDYLSLVATADVLLDPLHFGGVNSSYDGFSLNKPIVTMPSRFQRGRYTLACYTKMGIDIGDCVATTPEQYIELAVALGTEPERRAQLAAQIEEASGALFEDLEAVREHERIFGMLIDESRQSRH